MQKSNLTIAAVAIVFGGTFAGINAVYPADIGDKKIAQVAGEWTKCIAVSNGRQYNIVNGQSSQKRCHELAIKCTGDSNVTSNYRTNPVIINAPYTRCTAR